MKLKQGMYLCGQKLIFKVIRVPKNTSLVLLKNLDNGKCTYMSKGWINDYLKIDPRTYLKREFLRDLEEICNE